MEKTELNAVFSKRASVHTAKLEWQRLPVGVALTANLGGEGAIASHQKRQNFIRGFGVFNTSYRVVH